MKIKKAFSVAEILLVVAILGIVAMLVLNVINGQDNLQKEFIRRYEMSIPKLTDIAQFAAQKADTYEDWWADSNALSGLDCEAENHSDCLKRAFLAVSPQLEDCTTDDCKLILSEADQNVISTIFASVGALKADNLAHVKMSTGATLGLLYNDSECLTELKGADNRIVRACGLVFIDVNGNEPPNRLPTQDDPFSDRFMVAVTKNSVEHTELLSVAANCAEGTTYDTALKACTTNTCSIDAAARDYSAKVEDAHTSAPDLITKVYPDGEDKTNCYTVHCRTGAHPSKAYECPDVCKDAAGTPTGEVREGGIYLSNGGVIEDFEWSEKMCCTPVNNQTDLNNIRNNLSGTYCLMADIDFDPNGAGVSTDASRGWIPIGTNTTPFTGKFYGNGHKISGLKISKESACGGSHGGSCDSTYIGLFAMANGAVISDLELVDIDYSFGGGSASTSAPTSVGGVVGYSYLTTQISNVKVGGTISTTGIETTGDVRIGGISGRAAQIYDSVSNVNITLNSVKAPVFVGGITGNDGDNDGVVNNGSITIARANSKNTKVGGICGICSEVYNSINNGAVSVTSTSGGLVEAGGITGNGEGKIISNVVNTGNVSIDSKGTNMAGGIVGAMATSGNSSTGTLKNIYNQGTITAKSGSDNKQGGTGYLGTGGVTATTDSTVAPLKIYMDSRVSSPKTGHYDVLNTQNALILEGADAYSIWAYRTPAEGAELSPTDTLVFRWQCKPYREDGFDCCRPRYAGWEPDLPVCPAP